ncbi:MAG: histidine--tRNA ligase [Bacteroidetes bacterium]|nr:histidine--tRNA ligase [Bacteroidota bacterium]
MKPSIPKGTRDFSATEMARRNYIFEVTKKYFRLYGFEQIETPAMENLSTLTGKYGEEGDQLLFKILNSRIHESKEKEKLNHEFSLSLEKARNTEVLTERALRYDLTVPFARYVVMHQHELTFPFKRFQIQPVWRADKPQKGRYREFYQCDADMIGSPSLTNEIELIHLMNDVYKELKIPVSIKINNRKILAGIAELIGAPDKIVNITVAIDKLDKIGIENVKEELKQSLSATQITELEPLLTFKGNTQETILFLKQYLKNTAAGQKGIEELETIFNAKTDIQHATLELDITLARGLNYYTGAIFEVKANAGTFTSSITGGGRYDDLTGIFGLPNMSGVGISFGIDRIYDVMDELHLFDTTLCKTQSAQLLLMHMGEAEQMHAMQLLPELRKAGISAEVYPDVTKKLNKQFDYATKKDIPFLIVIGSNEAANKEYTLKTKTEKTEQLTLHQIIEKIKKT